MLTRRMITCERCGFESDGGARFCPRLSGLVGAVRVV